MKITQCVSASEPHIEIDIEAASERNIEIDIEGDVTTCLRLGWRGNGVIDINLSPRTFNNVRFSPVFPRSFPAPYYEIEIGRMSFYYY